MRTAILIDGAFFLRRFRRVFPDGDHRDPSVVAKTVSALAGEHLRRLERSPAALYRIYFYDAPPLTKRMHRPVSGRSIDYSKSEEALFRTALHKALRRERKLALRLGQLFDQSGWSLKPDTLSSLLKKERTWGELVDDDFELNVRQKAVDMRIGLDIASIAYRRLVDQVVLVAGDADFLPAAKLARREGIDFLLDPMGQAVGEHLHEHIDGVQSVRLLTLADQLNEIAERMAKLGRAKDEKDDV